jgi:hypothetical protein
LSDLWISRKRPTYPQITQNPSLFSVKTVLIFLGEKQTEKGSVSLLAYLLEKSPNKIREGRRGGKNAVDLGATWIARFCRLLYLSMTITQIE